MTYIIQTASERMPSSCKSHYRKIAVIEVDDGIDAVSMISDRAKGAIRVVRVCGRLHVGKTERSIYWQSMSEAKALNNKSVS